MNDQAVIQNLGYQPCRYGASKLMFRGPARQLRGEYIAYLGGSTTFGPMIAAPFPQLLEQKLGIPAVNLGWRNAGIDVYNASTALLDICSMSHVTVVQILGAAHMSNRFYTVDRRQNDRFIRASKSLKALFPEVDFTQFPFVSDLLGHLAAVGPERLSEVRYELQTAWVARMRTFLDRIEGPKLLLWVGDHSPFSAESGGTICRDPVFVDRAMLNAVKEYSDGLVEVVAKPTEINQGLVPIDDTPQYHDVEERILGPSVHDRICDHLGAALREIIDPGRNIFLGSQQRAIA